MPSLNFKLAEYIEGLDFQKTAFCLLVLTCAVYLNAIYHPFVHDDTALILENPQVTQNVSPVSAFLSPSSLGENVAVANRYYRPLVDLIYRAEYRIFRTDPAGYHLVNVVLHFLNGLLVYALLFLLTRRKAFSLVAASLFLIHPVQTEAVSSIAGLSNLSFAFWILASFCLYVIASRRSHGTQDTVIYASSMGCFSVALLCKEQAIFFLPLVFLYEACFGGLRDTKSAAAHFSGVVIVSAGYFLLRGVALGGSAFGFLQYKHELYLRILAIPGTLLMYLKTLVFPVELHYYRSVDVLAPAVIPACMLAAVLAVVFFIICKSSEKNLLIFGLGWFLFSLVPMSILPLINEYSFVLAAEHFLYIPVVGFLIFVLTVISGGLRSAVRNKAAIWGVVLFGTAVVVLAGVSIRQNTYWAGEIPLFKRMLQFEKDFARGHLLLAGAYRSSGQTDKAVSEYMVAGDILNRYVMKSASSPAKRFYVALLQKTHVDMAGCHEAMGRRDEAAREYKKALELDPGDHEARRNLEYILRNTTQGELP